MRLRPLLFRIAHRSFEEHTTEGGKNDTYQNNLAHTNNMIRARFCIYCVLSQCKSITHVDHWQRVPGQSPNCNSPEACLRLRSVLRRNLGASSDPVLNSLRVALHCSTGKSRLAVDSLRCASNTRLDGRRVSPSLQHHNNFPKLNSSKAHESCWRRKTKHCRKTSSRRCRTNVTLAYTYGSTSLLKHAFVF